MECSPFPDLTVLATAHAAPPLVLAPVVLSLMAEAAAPTTLALVPTAPSTTTLASTPMRSLTTVHFKNWTVEFIYST